MKKNMFKLLVVGAFLAFSTTAFAAASQSSFGTVGITSDAGGGPDISVKLSPNVQYMYKGGGGGTQYVIVTQNTKGTFSYGASQDISGLKMASSLVASTAVPSCASATSWTSTTWRDLGK